MMKPPDVYLDADKLCLAAANFWVSAYEEAIARQNCFHIALSGGTTPKRLYQKLATAEFQNKIDWHKVHFYFGDERFVPLDHIDSNFNMASLALLNHIDCPRDNIHPMPVTLNSAELAAERYDIELQKHLPENTQLDLILLGLGTDGHTASLFPDTDAVNEKHKLCRAVFVTDKKSWRISMTFPLINQSHKILLLSEGSAKSAIIKTLTDKNTPDLHYPIQHVQQNDRFFWFVDSAAMA